MTSPSPMRHVVVVGGGIAGLAAAWFLREVPGVRVTVLERSAELGGKLALAQVGGVTVETGAEAVLARRPEALELIEAVGLGADLLHPLTSAAGIWTRGGIRAMPRAQVMGVPVDLAELAGCGILSPDGVQRAARECSVPIAAVDEDVSVGELVRTRLGDEVVDRLVDPLLGGVYAGHADRLSLAATLPQLAPAAFTGRSLTELARAVRSAAPLDAPVFAGVRGGVGRLPGAVAAAGGVEIRTRTTVTGLRRTPTGWQLTTALTGGIGENEATGWGPLESDAVVLAVPGPAAARLLHALAPLATSELSGIPYASVAVVTLVLPPGVFPRAQVAGAVGQLSGFLVPAVDGRFIKAVTFSTQKWGWSAGAAAAAGAGLVLRASVGRFGEVADLQRDDAEIIAGVRADLGEALGLTAAPIDALVSRWGGSLPQYEIGHLDRVQRIREAVAALPGLAVCGAAYDGVGIAACISSARLAVARVRTYLAAAAECGAGESVASERTLIERQVRRAR
ncbi:MAG: protoporphyrinogen oxidase [Sporichthyaceae bacterium]